MYSEKLYTQDTDNLKIRIYKKFKKENQELYKRDEREFFREQMADYARKKLEYGRLSVDEVRKRLMDPTYSDWP